MNVRYRVELSQAERAELTTLLSRGKHAARKLKRAQILVAADAGAKEAMTRLPAPGGGRLNRIPDQAAFRGRQSGASAERGAAPRRGPKLTGKEEALLVATACASPPEGRRPLDAEPLGRCHRQAHRSPKLVARDRAPTLGRERSQAVAPRHVAHSPGRWRDVARMEDVLDLYAEAPDPKRPVICFDESPVQLIGEVRQPIPAAPGQLERYDYEYRRNGTVNLFVVLDVRKVDVDEVAQALSIVARRAAVGEADLAPRSMGDRLDLAAAGFKMRHAEGDGPPRRRRRSAQTLHLRLSQPRAVEPAA